MPQIAAKRKTFSVTCIVRPVKRDWAVLSKDTPVDIYILKSVRPVVVLSPS